MKSLLCSGILVLLTCCHDSAVMAAVFGHENQTANMVSNYGFENPLSSSDWNIRRADVVRQQQHVHTGSWAVEISDRLNMKSGTYQNVYFGNGALQLQPGSLYYLSSYVKLKDVNTGRYAMARYFYRFYHSDQSRDFQGEVGRLKFLLADGRWRQLGGDIETPPASHSPLRMEIYIRMEPVEASFYVDTFAMTPIPRFSDWRQVLDDKIKTVRRRRMRFRVKKNGGLPSNTRAEVEHVRHHYFFGTAIKAHYIMCNYQLCYNYQNFVKDNFNMAVCENDMKWVSMEKTENNVDFAAVDQVVTWCTLHGIRMRGHTLLWELEARNPSWLFSQTADEIVADMTRRITYMTERYHLEQWDVCNEFLNGHAYEQATLRDDLLFNAFNLAHSKDPNSKLCINDYLIARGGGILTSAQMELARHLLDENIPIGCIGILGHLRVLPISPERIQKRLEILSHVDLPIMVTEFSIHGHNESQRVEAMEQAMKLYYSEPSVIGQTVWGFSDLPGLNFEASSALTTGESFQPNAVGQKMLDLIHNEWTTRFSHSPTSNTHSKWVTAYHGQYMAKIYVDDVLVKTQEFEVNPGSGNTYVNVNI